MAVSLVRLRTLFAIFAIASLLLAGRLAYWQTIGRGELLGQATDQTRSDLVLAAQRGVVRDRSGAILATTVELRSLYAIPRRIADRGATAAALAPILGQSAEAIRAALDSGAEWLYLRRRLPEDVARRIAALRMEGLGFENEPKRLYPNGALGAHVLGFVNDDGQGQYGVEGRYDPILRGVDGRLVVERDPANRELAIGLRIATDPRRGQDLVLTLDLAVQTAVERELAAAIARGRAYGPTTVTQVLERSANAGAVFVASRLGADDLYAYLRAFGFGERTGVDVAAEARGSVRPLAEWYPVDVGTVAFGQGLSVTPLQLAAAYAAIANGGTPYPPYAAANRRDADGEH